MSETHSLSDLAYKALQELLKDAESCIRLTDWEETFLSDLRAKVLTYRQRAHVSAAMWSALERIEGKVYAI